MSLLSSFTKNSRLQTAINTVKEARKSEGGKADQLFLKAYREFADVVSGDSFLAQSLYNWGFALLQQARTQADLAAIKLYEEAIDKFTFCSIIEANFLGAAIDGGVALMELARIKKVPVDHALYRAAKEHFERAEKIHKGTAVYNLACIYALLGQDDQCLLALSEAVNNGSLPSEQEVLNDPDLDGVKAKGWFLDFIASLQTAKADKVELTPDAITDAPVAEKVVAMEPEAHQADNAAEEAIVDDIPKEPVIRSEHYKS